MDEILDNYELFIMVFLILLAITYAIFTFIINKDDSNIIQKEEPNEVKDDVITEEDRTLYASLLSFLPLDGETIKFLENHNMEKTFHGSKLDGLYAFYYDGNSEKHKFPNKKLDEKRNNIAKLAGNIIEHFSEALTLMENGQVVVTEGITELNKKVKKFTEAYRVFSEHNVLK